MRTLIAPPVPSVQRDIDRLSVNTIRTLSMDGEQATNSAPLWQKGSNYRPPELCRERRPEQRGSDIHAGGSCTGRRWRQLVRFATH
jgi:hypothetical protein